MLRRIVRRLRGDGGSAIVNVLVLMVVTSVVAVGMGTSIIVSGRVTMSTEHVVRTDAAAEAGIDYARAQIAAGDPGCSGWDQRAGDPSFTVAVPIYYDGSGAVLSCTTPLQSTVESARIVSTGFASTASAVSQQVGAVLAVNVPEPVNTSVGPAIYSYSSSGFGGGAKVYAEAGTSTTIVVQTGNVTCNGGAATGSPGTVSLVVQGNLAIDAGCNITGDAWSTGAVTVTGGGQVSGTVVGSSVYVTSSIGASIWTAGALTSSSAGLTIGGNVTAGSMNTGGSTRVNGSVEVAGTSSIGGIVGGHVSVNGNLDLSNTNVNIAGDVRANGTVSFAGKISGSLQSKGLTIPNAGNPLISGSAQVQGTTQNNAWQAKITGSLTTKALTGTAATSTTFVGGTKTITPTVPDPTLIATNPAAPAWPDVPTWYDYNYDAHVADWTSSGFQIYTMGADCSFSWWPVRNPFQIAIDSFHGQPGVIDARACSNDFVLDGGWGLTATNDVAIIADKFSFNGSGYLNSNHSRLWLITPDNTANGVPTCVAPGGTTLPSGFKVSNTVSVMVYTPCTAQIEAKDQTGSGSVHGQAYAGSVTLGSSGQIVYQAVGIPGVVLDGGAASEPVESDTLTVDVSSRYAIG